MLLLNETAFRFKKKKKKLLKMKYNAKNKILLFVHSIIVNLVLIIYKK